MRRAMPRAKESRIENDLIETMGQSLAWIVMGVLEGKTTEFEFNKRKLNNFYDFINEEKHKHDLDYIDTHEMINDAKTKRSYIFESCQSIPFSQLLYLAEVKGRRSSADPRMKAYLQAGYCVIAIWVDNVLKVHYRMNTEKRKEIFIHINNWIDSYQKGYLSNKGINDMFKEDINYDLSKGCDLDKQGNV